jgi:hypothetical protein
VIDHADRPGDLWDQRRSKKVLEKLAITSAANAPNRSVVTCRVIDHAGRPGGIMSPETLEKVLAKLATTDKATIVVEKAPDGKIRVTSGSWDGEKVILRGQVLEIRNVDERLHVARKERRHDEWDPPIEPYGPLRSGRPGRRRVTGNGPETRSTSTPRVKAFRGRESRGIYRRPIDVTDKQLDALEVRGLGVPLRRIMFRPWFRMIARVGEPRPMPPVRWPPQVSDHAYRHAIYGGGVPDGLLPIAQDCDYWMRKPCAMYHARASPAPKLPAFVNFAQLRCTLAVAVSHPC